VLVKTKWSICSANIFLSSSDLIPVDVVAFHIFFCIHRKIYPKMEKVITARRTFLTEVSVWFQKWLDRHGDAGLLSFRAFHYYPFVGSLPGKRL
jgi:hypothetical protein